VLDDTVKTSFEATELFKAEHDRLAERYRQKERANTEWTSNVQVTFGKLYEERDALEFQRKTLCNTLTEVSLERDRYRNSLAAIKTHQEMITNKPEMSTTWLIASKALAEFEALKKESK
jgi:hypothetical protein